MKKNLYSDRAFLEWIHSRMVNVFGDKEKQAHMQRLLQLSKSLKGNSLKKESQDSSLSPA